ncbi:hypothetical protein POM88_006901 [Heracleum sosnowskyi]|uniref:MULE transposase domain-containing protein n=1 Tax=Heracleum sosnowskyi TaxID=360622 RepID=A0AAD8N6Y1_9APIA|nr:hypothetical protein POM88_006901 [Heracleum sosnowskyi]
MDDEVGQTDKVEEPKVGIVFDTYEDLVKYYESYAEQEGFAVLKRTISKDDTGEKRYGTLFCSREDENGRLKSIFWADARSRAAYDEFGDVITFETTYLTNKYDMPFAPFVGVNHHGQSILLGCGLISHEDTNTFTWLFNSFLVNMYELPSSKCNNH